MSYWLRVGDPSGSTEVVGEIEQADPAKTHTGVGDFEIETAPIDLDSRAATQDRVDLFFGPSGDADNSQHLFRGFLYDTDTTRTGNSTLEGEGIGKLLRENEIADHLSGSQVSKTYSDEPAWKAIEDYWSLVEADLPFTVTVLEPPTSVINQDATVQLLDTTSEFNNALSFGANEPVRVNNGKVELLQSATFSDQSAGDFTGSQYVNGSATGFNEGDVVSFSTGSFNYTVPSGDWDVHIRAADPDNTGIVCDVVVNGNNLGNLSPDSLGWTTRSGNFDISSPSLELDDSNDSFSSAQIAIDAIVFEDTRFNHGGLDNNTDSNEQLSTPKLYAPYTVVFPEATSGLAIDTGYLDVTLGGTDSGVDKLQLSFDGGSTWKPTDGTELDTTSVSAQPSSGTRNIKGRVTLGPYGTRTNDSPTTGYLGNSIDVWDIAADQSNLKVIDELTVEGGDLGNLQRLHDLAAMRFLIEHQESDPVPVLSFTPNQDDSQVRRDIDFRELDRRTGVSGENYANTVVVVGDGDPGSRPRGVADIDDPVGTDGRVIKAGEGTIQLDGITTDAGARFAAEAILDQAQDAKEVRGELDIVAQDIPPGISVEVDFGNGLVWAPIEDVRFRGGEEAIGILNFNPNGSDLADELSFLDRNATGI